MDIEDRINEVNYNRARKLLRLDTPALLKKMAGLEGEEYDELLPFILRANSNDPLLYLAISFRLLDANPGGVYKAVVEKDTLGVYSRFVAKLLEQHPLTTSTVQCPTVWIAMSDYIEKHIQGKTC